MEKIVKDQVGVKNREKYVKCVVWDLDNTVWDGVLLEDKEVKLKAGITEIIRTLDNRGILQSIASKNDYQLAMMKLEQFGLKEYFLYPQINWNSKASSLEVIAKSINIGLDALAFIDDQPFELAEVNYSLPQILCINALDLADLTDMPEMNPRFITEDSRLRRQMYISDSERNKAEEEFVGAKEEFLATLNMKLVIACAQEDDLQRAEELTVRTNQLNTTGYTYSYDELNYFRQSENHQLLIASLEDRFGSYGKIGLSLVEFQGEIWTIKLLLMSCRVMSRGVGTILINHLRNRAKRELKKLRAEFLPNERNRMMYITYKFGGFREVAKVGELVILEDEQKNISPFPDYLSVTIAN
jgi:FkbH-like protein